MVLRIFKMIATSGFLTALECIKFVFDWGSIPDPTAHSVLITAYSALPDPLAGLTGPTSKGKGREGRRERGDKRKEGEGLPPFRKFLDPPLA